MSLMPISAPKIAEIADSKDPKAAILKAVGDLSKEQVNADLVLLGTFIRNMTIRGIIRPDVAEDEHQGKVGLVLKRGPLAYGDWEEDSERGQNAALGTWVVYHIKDAWQMHINGTPCRLVPYDKLRMTVSDPNIVY